MDDSQRLDKFLANRGACSRRNVDSFLQKNIVSVNGKRVTEAGIRINDRDLIRINGQQIKKPELKYYLLNKPKGVVSTTFDKHAKNNVVDLIDTKEKIYPVGRLDKETTGLLILTNDGEFTNLLTHPRYHVAKTYRLTIEGVVNDNQLNQLRNGFNLDDRTTQPAEVIVKEQSVTQTILEMTIHEGRNRQIRRMCQGVGIKLIELERIAIGPLRDSKLSSGRYRELDKYEVELLKEN